MIHRIRIQNFRSLRDVAVDLLPTTVFVGKSGTGKTNFAWAIRFLRDYLISPQAASQQFPTLKCATNPAGAVEFQVEFDVPGYDDPFVYSLKLHEQHGVHPPRLESLDHGGRTIFRQVTAGQGTKWEVEPALVSVPVPGGVALGRLPGLEEAVIAHTTLTTAVGYYAFPYGVLRDPEPGKTGLALTEGGGNYLSVLREITSSLHDINARKGIVAALRHINPTVASVELDSLQNPQHAIVAHRVGDKILTLDLREESEGFRRFYAHLLALYQPRPKQTLIFEEPENGIYPGALELLADEFKAAYEAKRGQVLLTTHSPGLLDHFAPEQIRVVDLVDFETRIGPLAEDQKEAIGEELLHSGELLTVVPARRKE